MAKSTIYPNVILPKLWWRLPFAIALISQSPFTKCRLCGINPCQTLSAQDISTSHNPHWFNRLRFLCQACHDRIGWQQSKFTLEFTQNSQSILSLMGVASGFYIYPLDRVMRDFKNQHQLHQLPILIHAIRQLDLPEGCHAGNSLILPMPTTPKRLSQRGFDPVFLLVQYLSFHWKIPIFPHIVREERQKQQGLDKAQRLENTQNAFDVTQSPFLDKKIKHLIVFDDVATTGATLQSLCQTILSQFPQANFTLHARAVAHGNG